MGMIGNYLRVNQEELENYISDSSLLEDRIFDEENLDDENLTDIDKFWEGLFFILTGKSLALAEEESSALKWIISPPQEIDPDQDLGYGPAFFTTTEQTKQIYRILSEISENNLRANYDPKLMNNLNIYPGIWSTSESLEYLIDSFNTLKGFYNEAVRNNQAVIVFFN